MSRLATVVLALTLYAGALACGADDPVVAGPEQPGSSSSVTPTPTSPSLDPTSTSSGRPTPPPGLPAGFPSAKVPVLYGVVTAESGGTGPDGRKGWLLELSATGSQASCFAEAAAALVAEGFTQQGEDLIAGDTRQAQFTSPEYAVIISVRASDEPGQDSVCQVGYEIGQVAP